MGLIAKKNGENNYLPTTPGTYQAVCYGVIDIGTHDVVDMKGNKKKKWQVIILWELPTERIEIDGNSRPRGVSKLSSGGAGARRPPIYDHPWECPRAISAPRARWGPRTT